MNSQCISGEYRSGYKPFRNTDPNIFEERQAWNGKMKKRTYKGPVQLLDASLHILPPTPITKEQADEIRLELMKERSKMVDTHTEARYESAFDM